MKNLPTILLFAALAGIYCLGGSPEPKQAPAAPPVAAAHCECKCPANCGELLFQHGEQIKKLQDELAALKAAPVKPVKAVFTEPQPAPKPQVVPVKPMTAVYQGSCANGQCGVRRGLFGRRR